MRQMQSAKADQLKKKRTQMTRAALELAIADAVRERYPECNGFIGIIIERAVPATAGGANWAIKGIKYGKAERIRCSAAISTSVEEGQREFELSE